VDEDADSMRQEYLLVFEMLSPEPKPLILSRSDLVVAYVLGNLNKVVMQEYLEVELEFLVLIKAVVHILVDL